MNTDIKWTHEGWFWCCPILAVMDGPYGISVQAKHAWLEPLFSLCSALESARIGLSTLLIPDYEPTFMFKLREISA